jgi:hypothetical protein
MLQQWFRKQNQNTAPISRRYLNRCLTLEPSYIELDLHGSGRGCQAPSLSGVEPSQRGAIYWLGVI